MRTRTRNRRGMALLDAIIGGIVLSIGLGVALSITSRAISAQTNGEKQMVAAWLADELLSMVVVDGPTAFPHLNDVAGEFEEPFAEYTFEVDIKERGEHEPFLVTARVRWGSEDGIEVESYVTERQGDPMQLQQQREPLEPVDREGIWLEREQQQEGL